MNATLTTLSIVIHLPAESLALLVALTNSGMPRTTIYRALSIFSCIGPLGMLLGIAISEHATPFIDGLVVALAAGTFIYVGATEMIAEVCSEIIVIVFCTLLRFTDLIRTLHA